MFAMFCNVFYFTRSILSLKYQNKQGKINVRMIYTLFKSKKKREESKSAKSTCVSLGNAKLCPTVRTKVPAPTCEVLPGATSGFNAWENWGDNVNT